MSAFSASASPETTPKAPAEPGNAASTAQAVVAAPKPVFAPHFYLHGGAGGMESTGEAYRETSFGLSLNLSTGVYLSNRWNLGAYYRDAFATNADMGMFGGSSYASEFYGLETEFAVFKGEKNEIRLGAKGGRVKVEGVSSALWIAYQTIKMTTWTAGPTLSYYHFFKPKFGIGVDLSYLHVFGKDASVSSYDGSGTHSVRAPAFNVADVGFAMQFRFQ
jgi:hypothetical protein